MAEKSSERESESSMEEILSSIKRIIAEDKAIEIDRPAEARKQAASRSKKVVDLVPPLPQSILDDQNASADNPGADNVAADDSGATDQDENDDVSADNDDSEAILELTNEVKDDPIRNAQGVFGDRRKQERLIDDKKLDAMRQSLSALVAMDSNNSPAPAKAEGQTSLEDMTREMMKPMLKQWLDDNLPRLVEEMVAQEIRRISEN